LTVLPQAEDFEAALSI